METKTIEFGAKIKEIRKFLHKTQAEFSEELGVTQANVSTLESGKTYPSVEFIYRLAHLIPLNANYLFFSEGDLLRNDTKASNADKKSIRLINSAAKLNQEMKRMSDSSSLQIVELMNKRRSKDNSKSSKL